MIALFRYVRGYVRVRIRGFSPERFLNLCSQKNMVLWDISKTEDGYAFYVSVSAFFLLRRIASKTKTKVAVQKKCGLPFFLCRMRKHVLFFIGLCLALFLWFVSGMFVWSIRITGNQTIPEETFRDYLAGMGIFESVPKKNLDLEELEMQIRRDFPEITWVSVKTDGTVLSISLREKDTTDYAAEEKGRFDLVAQKDGIIISMLVKKGTPVVKIGDRVEKDMPLVLGEVPILNDDETIRFYTETAADADIFVRRYEEITEKLPKNYLKKVYTGRECARKRVELGGFSFIIGKECPYRYYDTLYENKKHTILPGIVLPDIVGQIIWREYYNQECVYTKEEAKAILYERYKSRGKDNEEAYITLISEELSVTEEGGFYVLRISVITEEKIGKRIAR